jgi:protein phosphatase
MTPYRIRFGFRTDTGLRRSGNEDALLVLPKYGLYAVADGVGGRHGGEIASRRAMVSLEEFFKANPIGAEGETLESYFARATAKMNSDIIGITLREPDKTGMATTAVIMYLDGRSAVITNIGDSRCYMIRRGDIRRVTEDHSYVNELVAGGALSPEDAENHPEKNVITRALGATQLVTPDVYRAELEAGDRLLLCTDGLHGELTDWKIRDIINEGTDLNQICKTLVNAANEAGGKDNITCVLLEIHE